MSSRYSRAHELLIQQGANEEYVRLEPRNKLLKLAVTERDETIASLTKEVRALRLEVRRRKASSEDLDALRATALADALEIDGLRQRVEHGDNERQDWMRWAWVGQPQSENSDGAVYEAKIASLERALAHWERRVRNDFPARTQAQVDMDAAVVFSTRHLRLDDIVRLMEAM